MLLRKARVEGEIYNDLDSEIVNVFRVLRDPASAARLKSLLALTPFARVELEAAWEEMPTDPVERARRMLVRNGMSIGSRGASGRKNAGFSREVSKGNYFASAKAFSSYYTYIDQFVSRLSGVVIENMDAMQLIRSLDQPKALFYCDPPYLSGMNDYRCDFSGRHEELCAFLKTLQGHVLLSGYENEIYRHMLRQWHVMTHEALCFAGKKNREMLWIAPHTADALRAANADREQRQHMLDICA